MQATVVSSSRSHPIFQKIFARIRVEFPNPTELGWALLSALLLILAFPDYDFWPLAWIALIPLLLTISKRRSPLHALILGWIAGSVFFYATCYWLTFSMINYGNIPAWIAYLLLVPGAVVVGLFPGLFSAVLASSVRRSGASAMLLAPFIWISFEWARLGVTGQLWNALGYSQAYQPWLIQSARWGGVYAVSFLIVAINAALSYLILKRSRSGTLLASAVIGLISVSVLATYWQSPGPSQMSETARLVALQPNVPMHLQKSAEEMQELTLRHLEMSEAGLSELSDDTNPRIVIWPESPMNFTYAGSSAFRDLVTTFAQTHRTSVLFNSQEPAPNNGIHNSAVLVNEQGRLVSQYDKIRLLPFGEYVPLPRWLPGANLVSAIVGDFEAGTNYALLPIGQAKAGVFICIESAYPSIARQFSRDGAEVLINISNDGYLGRTAVMRQHLANAIFRAVENARPVIRVTNTGITAYIEADGTLRDQTPVFETATRTWGVNKNAAGQTLYTRVGDLFPLLSSLLTAVVGLWSVVGHRPR
ncbi:MAG TPA: apolipoprotein N-acyltransferase [Pyrinomonadaceae bacterium]|nr:apolipoprotein N-acyltransferase [Pyrinomonadaceae bacterium]